MCDASFRIVIKQKDYASLSLLRFSLSLSLYREPLMLIRYTFPPTMPQHILTSDSCITNKKVNGVSSLFQLFLMAVYKHIHACSYTQKYTQLLKRNSSGMKREFPYLHEFTGFTFPVSAAWISLLFFFLKKASWRQDHPFVSSFLLLSFSLSGIIIIE